MSWVGILIITIVIVLLIVIGLVIWFQVTRDDSNGSNASNGSFSSLEPPPTSNNSTDVNIINTTQGSTVRSTNVERSSISDIELNSLIRNNQNISQSYLSNLNQPVNVSTNLNSQSNNLANVTTVYPSSESAHLNGNQGHGENCLQDADCSSEFVCLSTISPGNNANSTFSNISSTNGLNNQVNNGGICDYPRTNLNTCPRGACSSGHLCQSGVCQPKRGMICNFSSRCLNGRCQRTPAIYRWRGTFGRLPSDIDINSSGINSISDDSYDIESNKDGWERLIDVPDDDYLSIFANSTSSGIEFWTLSQSGDVRHFNSMTGRWNLAVSSKSRTFWNLSSHDCAKDTFSNGTQRSDYSSTLRGNIVEIDRPIALGMANFGTAKGKVVVALRLKDRPFSIFAEILPDNYGSLNNNGYTLISRTVYPNGEGNGQIFFTDPIAQKMRPIEAIRISLHGDDRLTILGRGTTMNGCPSPELGSYTPTVGINFSDNSRRSSSRPHNTYLRSSNLDRVRIFRPTSTDPSTLYTILTETVTTEDLLDSYTSDRTSTSPENEFLNILHTQTDINGNQSTTTYNGQQATSPDIPIDPPLGTSEWSISSLSIWSDNPPVNVSEPTFSVLIRNQSSQKKDRNDYSRCGCSRHNRHKQTISQRANSYSRKSSTISAVPEAWVYNITQTSTGRQLQLQGHYPEGSLLATADDIIFLYSPSRCN